LGIRGTSDLCSDIGVYSIAMTKSLTTTQAAKQLRISRRAILDAIRRGRIKAQKLGSPDFYRYYIHPDEVEKYRLSKWTPSEYTELPLQTWSVAQICKKFGIHKKSVHYMIKRFGIEFEKRPGIGICICIDDLIEALSKNPRRCKIKKTMLFKRAQEVAAWTS
jgi:excisionase family DNA binding protein